MKRPLAEREEQVTRWNNRGKVEHLPIRIIYYDTCNTLLRKFRKYP
jgi:hypothetical protein